MDNRGASETAEDLQRVLLVEADMTVLPGMNLFLDSFGPVLKKAGICLDRDLFLRYLFGRHPVRGVAALIEKSGKSADASAVAADCLAAYLAALEGAGAQANEPALTFIREVAGQGRKVGLITQLPDAAARQVFSGVLGETVTAITETPGTLGVLGWEGWRRASRKLQARERLCVALCAPASARWALAASMRVAVVMNPMQEHLDAGGADLLCETLNASARASAMELFQRI
jgi:beta-phosphoglucomutase-like phosphatase (HAD superfamily)